MDLVALREDEVYSLTKKWFLARKAVIVGGQPPNGTDRFPVIEIKSGENLLKGSRGSYKPDLVVKTDTVLVLVECKPEYSPADVNKLLEVMRSPLRRVALYDELVVRGLLPDSKIRQHSDLSQRLRYCISFGEPVVTSHREIFSLVHIKGGLEAELRRGDLRVSDFD